MAEEFETIELEFSEDDILCYLEDEEGNEIGFVIEEDGEEVEYFYEGFEADDYETVSEPIAVDPEPGQGTPEEPKEHGYLYKMAAIAGHTGNKARKQAEAKLDVARGKAEKQYDKAKKTATTQAAKAKEKADDMGLGFSREGIAETTADLNAIAKEGAETVKDLKEAYDDIMENFGFMVPKSIRRKLP